MCVRCSDAGSRANVMHTNIQQSALLQLRSVQPLTYLQGGVLSSVGPSAAHLSVSKIETTVQES